MHPTEDKSSEGTGQARQSCSFGSMKTGSKEREQFAAKKPKALVWIKLFLFSVVLMSAGGVGVSDNNYTSGAESKEFEERFDHQATKHFEAVGGSLDLSLERIDWAPYNWVGPLPSKRDRLYAVKFKGLLTTSLSSHCANYDLCRTVRAPRLISCLRDRVALFVFSKMHAVKASPTKCMALKWSTLDAVTYTTAVIIPNVSRRHYLT
jgi:hypothetical protein